MCKTRTHPFTIFENLYRFLYLLILPVLRGFVSGIQGGFSAWLAGAWFDVLVVLTLLVMAALRWRCLTFSFDASGIRVSQGIVYRKHTLIPAGSISTLALISSFYLRPFHAVRVRIDTLAGSKKNPDVTLIVDRETAQEMLLYRQAEERVPAGVGRQYSPHIYSVIALSVFTSNSFAGIVFVATFIQQSGQVLGSQFSDVLYSSFERLTRILAFGIPPAFAAVAYLLLFGWTIAFAFNLLRNKDLMVRRESSKLHITSSVGTKRIYSVRAADISYIDIRQSVLTKILAVYSVFLYAAGFGKDKTDIFAIVPFSSRHNTLHTVNLLLPEYQISPRQLKPNAGAIFKFILDPLWPCGLVPLATYLGYRFLPDWKNFILYIGLMLCIPAYWFFAVRFIDYLTSGIAHTGDFYTLRYSGGFYLHTVVASESKIAMLDLRQSIIQRMDKKCDLLVYSRSEGVKRHHLRNLEKSDLLDMFGIQSL